MFQEMNFFSAVNRHILRAIVLCMSVRVHTTAIGTGYINV
jgi:hypothetical protein